MKGLWKPKRKTADHAARLPEMGVRKKKLKTNISRRTSHYLPHDLLFSEVLARLPAKSLCRFQLVCRGWSSGISEAIFAREQSRHDSSTSSGMIYCDDHRTLKFLPTQGTAVGIPNLFVGFQSSPSLELITSTNGLIVVGVEGDSSRQRILYVCNPVTGERERIPTITDHHSRLPTGLAFDPSSSPDQYKIILIERTTDRQYMVFWVFSSTSGRWTSSSPTDIEFACSLGSRSTSVFAGGVIYWYCTEGILRYDASKQIARVTELPWENTFFYSSEEIGVWENRLTCTRRTETGMEIWAMDMDGKLSMRHRIHMEQVIQRNLTVFDPVLPKPFPVPGRDENPELCKRLWKTRPMWKWLRPEPLPYYGGKNIYFRVYLHDMGKGEREVIMGCDTQGDNVVVLCDNKVPKGGWQHFFYSYHNSFVPLPRQVSSVAMPEGRSCP